MTEFYQRLVELFGTENSAEIARQLQLERQSVYRWRDGKNDPSLDTLYLINQLTGASLHWLLTGQGPKYVSNFSATAIPLDDEEMIAVIQFAADSDQTVEQALHKLIVEGLKSRKLLPSKPAPSMLLFRQDVKLIAIPLIGSISAGQPINYFKEQKEVLVADVFISHEGYQSFVLQIVGDDFRDEGFSDGDLIICCDNKQPQSGQVAVTVVDDEHTTIKRVFFEGPNIRLQPTNGKGAGELISPERVTIIATVTGVQRDP